MAKRKTPGDHLQRRLAAVESLCRYARAAVILKRGDSAKLYRAEEDLNAAIEALTEIRASMPLDAQADGVAASGQLAELQYISSAKHTPRTAQ